MDWNPVSEFCAHEFWRDRPDTGYSHSTYLDARHVLPAQVITDIESYREKDPNWWNVYGLGLVSQLAHSGLAFRFKGGNSQLVLLDDPQRYSIDADIVTTVAKEELISSVQRIAEECELFHDCEVRQHKTKPWLPMVSFNLFFTSCSQEQKDSFVMLDADLELAPYPGLRKRVQ